MPFPGDFHGVSTRPTCFGGSKALICNNDDDILSDEECGDEVDSMDVDPSKFLAWSSSSRITLQCEAEGNVAAVRQVNLCFYHDPESGVGLPDFRLSASDFVSRLGDPLSYWSQDPPSDYPGVRNVTLVLTEQITDDFQFLHIGFNLKDDVHQFAVSEMHACNTNSKPLQATYKLHLTLYLPVVVIDVESGPALNQSSESLTGPDILLPANQTLINSPTVTLTCTVIGSQGYFKWQWDPKGYTPVVSDDTRTSSIEIPVAAESVGEYNCTVSYYPSPVTATFTVDTERKYGYNCFLAICQPNFPLLN